MVIVGAGECGTRAAFALRENGWEGRVTLVGAEPDAPYERPPLSKTWTLKPICDDAALRTSDITFLAGTEVVDLDTAAHELTLGDGSRLGYHRLLLATGARARPLPLPGAAVHLVRTHADARALRAELSAGIRVGVIGGGFIGLELAAAASALGATVTVLELAPRLMGRAVPARIAAELAARHAAAGIDVRCGTAVTDIVETARRHPRRPGRRDVDRRRRRRRRRRRGTGDHTGREGRPGHRRRDPRGRAVADLGAGRLRRRGLLPFPAPALPGRELRLESWRAAQDHGNHAARSMLGATDAYARVPWFWSDQHDLSLQVAGLTTAATRDVVRTRPDGVEIWFGLADDGRLVAAAAVGPGNAVAKDVRLAEMLIAAEAVPDPAALSDPSVTLKSILRAPIPV